MEAVNALVTKKLEFKYWAAQKRESCNIQLSQFVISHICPHLLPGEITSDPVTHELAILLALVPSAKFAELKLCTEHLATVRGLSSTRKSLPNNPLPRWYKILFYLPAVPMLPFILRYSCRASADSGWGRKYHVVMPIKITPVKSSDFGYKLQLVRGVSSARVVLNSRKEAIDTLAVAHVRWQQLEVNIPVRLKGLKGLDEALANFRKSLRNGNDN